jgi:hypothetical protein
MQKKLVKDNEKQEELERQARGLMYNIMPLVVISPLESSS